MYYWDSFSSMDCTVCVCFIWQINCTLPQLPHAVLRKTAALTTSPEDLHLCCAVCLLLYSRSAQHQQPRHRPESRGYNPPPHTPPTHPLCGILLTMQSGVYHFPYFSHSHVCAYMHKRCECERSGRRCVAGTEWSAMFNTDGCFLLLVQGMNMCSSYLWIFCVTHRGSNGLFEIRI